MRAANIQDLPGHFGPITSSGIWERVQKYQLERLYFDIRQITREIMDECRKRNTLAGINIEPKGWFNEDLAAAARRVHLKLNDLGFGRGPNVAGLCPVLFDYEFHGIVEVLAGLKQWRALRSARDTVWSMEPMQGGWVGDPQMQAVIRPDKNLVLMPQTYRWNMGPVAQDACRNDLERFYDTRQVKLYYQSFYKLSGQDVTMPPPEQWDGCVYDMEHLPL